jgi:GTP-binding protein
LKVKTSSFVGSFPKESACPKTELPEYAFIGRSNVGKSSLINMLCSRKEIAKVSKTPGKTQLLNFFLINESWHLVDLPGYGFAKISKSMRRSWEKMIEHYLVRRENLKCAFVLIDLRLELQKIDLEFINWLGSMQIPFVIVFTKSDGVKPAKHDEHVHRITNELLKYWNSLPEHFVTSSSKSEGREEILAFIERLNNSN